MELPDTLPSPLRFNVQGVATMPHGKHPPHESYLVHVAALRCWMPVRQALQGGMVAYPPLLPASSRLQAETFNHAEEEARVQSLVANQKTP
jgi:hypothetical protein